MGRGSEGSGAARNEFVDVTGFSKPEGLPLPYSALFLHRLFGGFVVPEIVKNHVQVGNKMKWISFLGFEDERVRVRV